MIETQIFSVQLDDEFEAYELDNKHFNIKVKKVYKNNCHIHRQDKNTSVRTVGRAHQYGKAVDKVHLKI